MTRNEFIARIVAQAAAIRMTDDNGHWNPAALIEDATDVAKKLTEAKSAPWQEQTDQDRAMERLPEFIKKTMDSLNFDPLAPKMDDFLVFGGLEVNKPSSVKSILSSISAEIPETAALPPGRWEIGFRPMRLASAANGIVKP